MSDVIGVPSSVFVGVIKYIYSTPSPSVPSSPHLAHKTQLDHFPQDSSFFCLVQTTSIGFSSLMPLGEAVHMVFVKESVVSGTTPVSVISSSLVSNHVERAMYVSILGNCR